MKDEKRVLKEALIGYEDVTFALGIFCLFIGNLKLTIGIFPLTVRIVEMAMEFD